jgi:hypothetical protein
VPAAVLFRGFKFTVDMGFATLHAEAGDEAMDVRLFEELFCFKPENDSMGACIRQTNE